MTALKSWAFKPFYGLRCEVELRGVVCRRQRAERTWATPRRSMRQPPDPGLTHVQML